MVHRDLAPTEGHSAWAVSPLLDQRFVELAARTRVNLRPAVLTIVLQTCHIGAEERCELSTTASTLAFVTHLVV